MTEPRPIVIDSGSETTKAGFAGDEAPHCVFPSIVCRSATGRPDYYVGDDAWAKRDTLPVQHIIENGVVNWDDMENLWEYTFHRELNISPADHAVLLTEPAYPPTGQRGKMAEVMFETFKIPALCIRPSAVLALHGSGRSTGIVLESGYGASRCVPIHDGQLLRNALREVGYAGQEITELLMLLLNKERGYELKTRQEREIIEHVKKAKCYVAVDYEKEMQRKEEMEATEHTNALSYELPDGRIITMGYTRFFAPEALFQPAILGLDQMGFQDMVLGAVMNCDESLRPSLLNNIVFSGGNTMFSGLAQRLHKELAAMAPSRLIPHIKVHALPERKYLTWVGSSIFAYQSTFDGFCCTKQEYEEVGEDIIHRKCI
ncbi:actin family [Mycena amicta]|nr:actin family [Mycena amicta]